MRAFLKVLELLCISLMLCTPLNAFGSTSLQAGEHKTLLESGHIYAAGNDAFPASARELPTWLAQRQTVPRVSLFGGAYWLAIELHNDSAISEWVLAPGRLIDNVEVRVYADDQREQRFVTGYRAAHDYMLHYGKKITLPSGAHATILMRIESPYYASAPTVKLFTEQDYRQLALSENVQAIAAFGALAALAVFNFFVFLITRDRAVFYYSVYLGAYLLGWVFTFQLPAEMLGWHDLRWHYIPFFLLPILNTMFYVEFLQLRTKFPRLARVSRINLVLPLVLLPSCFLALSFAHLLASVVISIWLVLALVCGIASLRSGFQPARYFVLAFIALLIPGAIILPANLGLTPELVDNSELLTLLGGTLDAILLAFALADKIRMLANEKDHALEKLEHTVTLAHTDHLTGIANRHAFDQQFKHDFEASKRDADAEKQILFLIDLDGLKSVNDRFGHARGDELLCAFAKALARMETKHILVYRLGGDEFTILARKHHETKTREALVQLEHQLEKLGFSGVGVSFGVGDAHESKSPADMLARADSRMYEYKISRRRKRAADHRAAPASSAPDPS